MLNGKNIINDKIASVINNNSRKKEALTQRYKIDSETPWNLKFIDRLCLDSREVALGHTAGIATPGQAIMGLFSLYNLLHQETYKPAIQGLLKDRVNDLFDNTDPDKTLPRYSDNPLSTNYYALIDILTLAEKKYTDGKGFAKFLLKTYYPVDFVCQLAYQRASVVLPGYGFFEKENTDENTITPEDHNNWSIRVSLANLDSAAYPKLGRYISELLDLYHNAFTSPA
ncbi:MAG: hypothetical protein GY757_11165, partial [bacterium]|nr:hypothetical protein [bacterium]